MTRCYSWAEFTERYDETEADHRCDLCGGWVATCGCPPGECESVTYCTLPLGHAGICEEREQT